MTHGCSRISFRRDAARTEVDIAPQTGNVLPIRRNGGLCIAVSGPLSQRTRGWLIETDSFVNARSNRSVQSECSLSSILSAAFPARLASVMVSKKTAEHSIALFLPAR